MVFFAVTVVQTFSHASGSVPINRQIKEHNKFFFPR